MQILAITNNFFGVRGLKNNNSKGVFEHNLNNEFNAILPEKELSFKSTTSAGTPLRKLKHIIDPYFGTKMISGMELPKIEYQIEKCKNIKDIVKVLYPYRTYMQKIEKNIFKKIQQASKSEPEITIPQVLKRYYNEALIRLKLEEFNVLDDVDKISIQLSPQKALEVHHKTTRCRQVILDNKENETFKRKVLLSSLEEIKPANGEKKIFETLKDRAIYLPTSGTSENAFIVKYADRTQTEIAKRIMRASLATIEHVKPSSKSGKNEIQNFLLVSESANSARSNMPLPKFIARFPIILKNCQKYIEQIMTIIRNGGLRGNETYPYKIKKTLFRESKGLIDLDLSNYKYSEAQAKKVEKNNSSPKYKKNKRKR